MAKDIALDIEGDLLIQNGDFVIADSDEQHIQDIIQANKGDFREAPLLGGEIDAYRNAPGARLRAFEVHLRKILTLDHFEVNTLKVNRMDGDRIEIGIDARRND